MLQSGYFVLESVRTLTQRFIVCYSSLLPTYNANPKGRNATQETVTLKASKPNATTAATTNAFFILEYLSFSCFITFVTIKRTKGIPLSSNWSIVRESNPRSQIGSLRHSHYANDALEQVVGVEPTHLRWQRKRLPLHHTCFLTMNTYYHHQRKWQAGARFYFLPYIY